MKPFIHEHFLLETQVAQELYHDVASGLPIIDYHSHLPPEQIASNHQFENITQVWLYGDHYKWRAMRAFGIDEHFITGAASDKEKFLKWTEVCPHTLRNPLFHWTQMELKRYFGIEDMLNPDTAESIYEQTQEQLQSSEFSAQALLQKMNVEVVCTTDDPVGSLEHHAKFREQNSGFSMLPAFRPDNAMDVSNPKAFAKYARQIGEVAGIKVKDLHSYMAAVNERHTFFAEQGCKLSDHGLAVIDSVTFTGVEIEDAFDKVMEGKTLSIEKQSMLRSFFLLEFAKMDHEKGWVQQFHLGAIRNINSRLLDTLGPDTGFDSIGDYSQAESLARFLDTLDQSDQLAKTILYNSNPADNEVFATMAGNYNDGTIKGKMQWGSAWWFLDQLDGMEKQINTLSNVGLLSCFVGMLTDSRSFLSFPRHEYFRRLLCNILGNDVAKGYLPNDKALLSKLVEDVCYNNAKQYFNFS